MKKETKETYFAWKDKKGKFSHIYSTRIQVKMCFPDYGEHQTEIGEGRIVEVKIKEAKKNNEKKKQKQN